MKSMAHLLIDGYNLMHFMENRGQLRDRRHSKTPRDLEDRRRILLERLLDYQSRKDVELTIVFDSMERVALLPKRTRYGEILVLFSDESENADQRIIKLCEEHPGHYVVISNDEEVLYGARQNQCLTMNCREFAPKLLIKEKPSSEDFFADEEDLEDDRPLYPRVSTKKKGAARRLPKGERRRKSRLRHL